MRHSASLLASLEGLSRAAFLLAKELSQASRAGLTPRFLSRKLDLPIEEVEYLVDVNHKLLYADLTKIRLAPEGFQAVKRILGGLESHGDVPALCRKLRSLPDQDLQRIEERLGLDAPSKKELQERFLAQVYGQPESVTHYVASRGLSSRAREVFDCLWQSREGIMTIIQLHAVQGGSEYDIEQALWELLQGGACFEIFRFDSEDRLVRAVALLKELRDYRRTQAERERSGTKSLRPVRGTVDVIHSTGLSFSECICRLTAAIAAHPVRLRNDGELFREDRRRLEAICSDDDDPSLSICLWAAQGLGWLAQVDNTLHAGAIDDIIGMDRVQRHRLLYKWLAAYGADTSSYALIERALCELKHGTWYRVMEFINSIKLLADESHAPQLRHAGAHYEYVSPSISDRLDARAARALDETYYWLGAIERSECDGEPCFRVTELGAALLTDEYPPTLLERYPARTCSFVVQPNFEIVASVEDMDPLMTAPLEMFADRISEGQVLVYRLSRDAFVRAMQEGRHADNFIAFLLDHSRNGLPENVRVTLRDWCGTAKAVRLRTYHVIEADDPLVIAELEHNNQWQEHIEPVEGHKALRYHGVSKTQIKRLLEKDGYIVR